MNFHNTSDSMEQVGILGAGSFGTALANIIAENKHVLLYARREDVIEELSSTRKFKDRSLHQNISFTHDLEQVIEKCELLFPVVPAASFRELIKEMSSFLKPYHKLIHATKGLDVKLPAGETLKSVDKLKRDDIRTMTEVITEETVVVRVGCVAGPNLATELQAGQPAATVVASRFDEVIREGTAVLRIPRFRVHGNNDLFGIELAGVLKNIMAVAAGMLKGLDFGDNTRALLVTHGLAEIIALGTGVGANVRSFLGLAGIGDLVATCSSPLSRNFTLGYRVARGEKLTDVIEDMEEVAEGVRTISIARALSMQYKISAPITHALYRILFQDMDIRKGMNLLMEYPYTEDVHFI